MYGIYHIQLVLSHNMLYNKKRFYFYLAVDEGVTGGWGINKKIKELVSVSSRLMSSNSIVLSL